MAIFCRDYSGDVAGFCDLSILAAEKRGEDGLQDVKNLGIFYGRGRFGRGSGIGKHCSLTGSSQTLTRFLRSPSLQFFYRMALTRILNDVFGCLDYFPAVIDVWTRGRCCTTLPPDLWRCLVCLFVRVQRFMHRVRSIISFHSFNVDSMI
jgi:hypothetical protein